MTYTYKPKGVCPNNISFDIEGDKVTNIKFSGGCNGNLKAISKLVDGMTIDEIEKKLKGNTCGFKDTSCADQLALAVREAYEKENS
ncbi:MAG: TIGR03905 family TSCPD domain-containing protein [Lachnospiraceae bacterium]|nr:TIGR03905 family TSCPD domain-containing protein [Lachnospiraceae bacterium]